MMKLEHYVFFSLLLTAAIITGSTLGLASGFPYVAEQVQKNQIAQLSDSQTDSTQPMLEEPDSSSVAEQAVIGDGVLVATAADGDIIPMTPAEKTQVLEMLTVLGMSAEADLSSFIASFQQKYTLDATGLLDAKTLYLIIEETKREKAYMRQAGL